MAVFFAQLHLDRLGGVVNFLAYVRGNELTEWERELNVEWEFVIIRNILERFFRFPIG